MNSATPIMASNPDASDEFPLHALGNDIIELRERNVQPLNTLPGNDYPRRRIAYLFRQRAPIDQMADFDEQLKTRMMPEAPARMRYRTSL